MPKPASTRPAYKMLTCIYLCRTLLFFAPYADFYDKKLCLTPKYLSSTIKEVSGKLAGDWIDNYVIIEAKALLISTNLTVQEICYELNFSTPSSFTRFFKRITGMSPRKFRTIKVFPNLIE